MQLLPVLLAVGFAAHTTAHRISACDCVVDSSLPCCATWKHHNATAEISDLCAQQKNQQLFACKIFQLCTSTQLVPHAVHNNVCDNFAILRDGCLDLATNQISSPIPTQCSTPTRVCSSVHSRVPQCIEFGGHNLVLGAEKTRSHKSCGLQGQSLQGCRECDAETCVCRALHPSCSKFRTQAQEVVKRACPHGVLVHQQGGQVVCTTHHKTSVAEAGLGNMKEPRVCNGQSIVMLQGFTVLTHSDDPCVAFLFPSWILDTRGKIALGAVGTFLLALLHAATRWALHHLNHNKKTSAINTALIVLCSLVEATLLMALMLLAMTFYVWLFVSAVLGLAVGRLGFGGQFLGHNDDHDSVVDHSSFHLLDDAPDTSRGGHCHTNANTNANGYTALGKSG